MRGNPHSVEPIHPPTEPHKDPSFFLLSKYVSKHVSVITFYSKKKKPIKHEKGSVDVFCFVGQMLRIGHRIMEITLFVRKKIDVFRFYGSRRREDGIESWVIDRSRRQSFVHISIVRRVHCEVLASQLKSIFA